jgi:mono/diheme cytochrome c family protein
MIKRFVSFLKGLKLWQKILMGILALVIIGGLPAVIYHFATKNLPAPLTPSLEVLHLNNDVWTEDERQRYYHLSQGSEIMPYDWFVALEQGDNAQPFIADDNLTRYRLIPDPNVNGNPDRLPIGFAKDDADPVTGTVNVGLSCAGCHTAQMTYKGTGIHIDGAPGMVDFTGFIVGLVSSIGVTTLSPTLIPGSKFDRFAHKVLKDKYSPQEAVKLKVAVGKFLKSQLDTQKQQAKIDKQHGQSPTVAGFGRIDALGAGGNRLYGQIDPKNLRTLDAPVKAVPLWYTHEYNWVQTNGSLRQPMARNIIEALAVNASLVFPGDPAKNDRYTSSVRLNNMFDLESQIKKFKSPVWPEKILGKLDQDRIKRGAVLYQRHCAACHEPQKENQPEPSDPVAVKNNKTFFVLRMLPTDKVGTDPLDAKNFAERRLDASSIKDDAGKQMGKDVAGAEIIGMVLSGIINRRYAETNLPVDQQEEWNGYRANLLRACSSYPARPLAGVWANAPYLHNGSVHSLYQLLLPENERDKKFFKGSVEFDPVQVGYEMTEFPGAFEFDTSFPGNANTGHQYGTSLSQEERMDLIEFLKDLKFPEKDYQLVAPASGCS